MPRKPQQGNIFESHGAFHVRYYVRENGRLKRRSYKLCVKDDLHPSTKAPAVVALAESFILKINQANVANNAQAGHNCPLCGGRCTRTLEGKFAPGVRL